MSGVGDSSHQIISLDHEEVGKTYQRVRRQIKQRIEPEIRFDFDPVPVTTEKCYKIYNQNYGASK